MLLLIDADPIVYRCGFAAEQTSWHVIYETDKAEADEIQFHADDKGTAGGYMREWMDFHPSYTILSKSRVVKPDPVSYALRATKVQIESIISECEAKFGPAKMLMWLSGKGGSYRDRIATVRPYKGNRDPTHKPYHYDAIRDYLRTEYGSYLTDGIEADDAVSIFAHTLLTKGDSSYVVCTIDKDLDQIPGQHYNYMNKVFYAITQTEAERWFIYQLLAGDTTDNIVGVWKCGPKQAIGILNSLGDWSRPSKRLPARILESAPRNLSTGDTGSATGDSTTAEASDASVHAEQRQLRVPNDTTGNYECVSRANYQYTRASGSDTSSERTSKFIAGVSRVDCSDGAGDTGLPGITADAGTEGQRPESSAVAAGDKSVRKSISYPWWRRVVAAYADSQRRPDCPYAKDNPEAVAIEMAQLVKLQEYPGQLWHPHGDLVVPGFGEADFDGV